ncbi:putative ribonuclease H protein [Vitis vinifera]|uniref:Putative ribonuclease H protein n=1 Tax=Vitis vinifera TaxID=29760 RepID=A0A438I8S3_VITVI|nr:putative ribonuclease H protein [Vitis vinifera]
MSEGVVKSLGAGRFLDWRALEASGSAGDVLICWDKRSIEILYWEEGQFSISCKFRNVENGVVWVFTGVYGPFTKEDRESLWDEFGAIRGIWGEPWCVGGDFNIILSQGERSKQGRVTSAMRRFAQVIDDLELVDLPLQGGSFTWSGGLHNQAWARLDRFLVSSSWLDQFENMWLKVEGFKDLMRSWWQGMLVRGRASYKLATKLKQVEYWDQVESERRLTEEEISIKKEAKEGYAKWVNLEEIHWRQLSKELWLKGGDRNTEEQEVRIGIADAFKQLLTEDSEWKADEFVKAEVLEMFKEFHEQNSFLKSLNNTFLVLLPKKGGVEELRDFKLISLLGGLYKLLAKVLANRIKKVIGKVVSPDQNAFVMGRQILDASLIANEEGYGRGFISGCNIWRGSGPVANISHLIFADDTIVFCEAKKEDMTYLSWILCWFEAVSGLRINLAKSEIIPVGEVEEILEMAVELGCKVGQLPSAYLGLPLGAPNKASSVWDGVEERVRWKLALWKRQYISKGGRITLIKSTLASMPLYQLSLFRMPKIVARRLEKLKRDFLWGGGNMERKAHLVNWEMVWVGKEKGGFGLRKLVPSNKALLGKWVWRFARAKDELWKQVLTAEYGQEEFGWRTKKANGAFGVGVWKEILKESDWCWDNMTFNVGKGTRIRFWTDPWCEDVELSLRFPQLYAVATHRNTTVGEMWDQNFGQGG